MISKKDDPFLGPHKDRVTWNETKRYYGVLDIAAAWIKQQNEAPMLRECFKTLVRFNLVHDTEEDYKSLLTRARGLVGFPAVAHDPADDRKNTDWKPIIATAKSWVEAQPYPVTLRQCFYHLVATHEIKENTEYRYTNLSRLTSDAGWMDEFPDFSDESHSIYALESWSDIEDYAEDAALGLTLDRTMGQEYQVVVGVEKRGMRAQASRLFSKRGWKIVPLGGYGSTTIKKRLVAAMEKTGVRRCCSMPEISMRAERTFSATSRTEFRLTFRPLRSRSRWIRFVSMACRRASARSRTRGRGSSRSSTARIFR